MNDYLKTGYEYLKGDKLQLLMVGHSPDKELGATMRKNIGKFKKGKDGHLNARIMTIYNLFGIYASP
ncbi:MAG: hypothetical protein ACFFD4_00965 [Candidatus Odinarchaeota archaeon]